MDKEMELVDLKKNYEIVAKQYGLPDFKTMNEEFEIEKITHESETLLRAVRKVILEKILNSMSFLEILLNPVNVPRMYVSFVRGLSADDKKEIDKIYDSFAALGLEGLDNEIDYSEKAEAELIKKCISTWNSIKPEFRKIITNMKKPVVEDVKKERSYYG
jgi:hypothetical protein